MWKESTYSHKYKSVLKRHIQDKRSSLFFEILYNKNTKVLLNWPQKEEIGRGHFGIVYKGKFYDEARLHVQFFGAFWPCVFGKAVSESLLAAKVCNMSHKVAKTLSVPQARFCSGFRKCKLFLIFYKIIIFSKSAAVFRKDNGKVPMLYNF